MVKLKNFSKSMCVLAIISLIPVSMAAAAKPESNSSDTGKTTQMLTTAGEQTTGTVSTEATNTFYAGSATLTTYNMGGGKMEAAWTLVATNGLITSVNLATTYDTGTVVLDTGSRMPNSTQHGASQLKVGGPLYHTATLSGTCWVNYGIFVNTIVPVTDGVFVSP